MRSVTALGRPQGGLDRPRLVLDREQRQVRQGDHCLSDMLVAALRSAPSVRFRLCQFGSTEVIVQC
mgnify:CR=1 FL=1